MRRTSSAISHAFTGKGPRDHPAARGTKTNPEMKGIYGGIFAMVAPAKIVACLDCFMYLWILMTVQTGEKVMACYTDAKDFIKLYYSQSFLIPFSVDVALLPQHRLFSTKREACPGFHRSQTRGFLGYPSDSHPTSLLLNRYTGPIRESHLQNLRT